MEQEPILEIGKAKSGIEPAQIVHCAPRFIHSARERMTRRNYADSDEEARQISQRLLSPRRSLVEATRDQVRKRRSALHSIHFGIERAGAHGVSQALDRIVWFTPHDLHDAAQEPGGREVWIEEQRLIDERDATIEVAYEICQRVPSAGKDDSIILAELDRATRCGRRSAGVPSPAVIMGIGSSTDSL